MTAVETIDRIVDARNQGWFLRTDGCYQPDPALPGHPAVTLDGVRRLHGPVRPVLPVDDDDVSALTDLYTRCGRKAIATLTAAVEAVFHQLREQRGGTTRPNLAYQYAKAALTAGDASSWESETLLHIAMYGTELNLLPLKRGGDPSAAARRAAGPVPRVDRDGRDAIAEILYRWVTDPRRYTEVASTLAFTVAWHADQQLGATGWNRIADQWLRPTTRSQPDRGACYRLFYSQSKHYNNHLT